MDYGPNMGPCCFVASPPPYFMHPLPPTCIPTCIHSLTHASPPFHKYGPKGMGNVMRPVFRQDLMRGLDPGFVGQVQSLVGMGTLLKEHPELQQTSAEDSVSYLNHASRSVCCPPELVKAVNVASAASRCTNHTKSKTLSPHPPKTQP